MSVAVLFLARGEGGGRAACEAFFESWRDHPAGLAHELIVILKGWSHEPDRQAVEARARALGGRLIEVPDDGYDWGAYLRVARGLERDWLCPLNTHSRLRADHWLAALMNGADRPGVGCAGATGSWGTNAPVFRSLAPTIGDYRRRKGELKALAAAVRLYALRYPWDALAAGHHFPGFPNPHLRSNAFLVRRTLFAAFAEGRALPRDKRDALVLECGHAGFPRFLARQGLRMVVAGADGGVFPPEGWPDSRTFCVPEPANLLVSDNRTRAYDAADPWSRRAMELFAWGRRFTPPPTDPASAR